MRHRSGRKLLLYGGAIGLLLLVFALYGRANFLFTLANQVWGCF